ncbi:peptidyl-prolyl cis-trans isomerase A (cyclophilin A) [Nitrosomonas sp. PY1]|uniref:peptidylprolyl isomerase n=1 Tax=Nitrosomonas sp. PY1 TaxID=1803906 RepID=UPI001FC8CA5C|nr:peptidylprolyl isomerase [Nitrosomonas sp. PY1]GKS68360.1 peptidyl-prolyl cis-trans isomerase A (cyclophilin A) [Nitrosomonas sp. PY1]
MAKYLTNLSYKAIQIVCWLILLATTSYANSVACFTSNIGQFCIELFESHTPLTTANFLNYIHNGSYTNGIFHRSIPGFVIQGGGFKIVDSAAGKSLATVATLPPINNEFKISNTRGTVAMAKIDRQPDSATSQWFVNLADNSGDPNNLDTQNSGFTVFGRVIFDGMSVFDAIAQLPRTSSNLPYFATNESQIPIANLVQIIEIAVKKPTGVFHESVASFAVDIGDGSNILEVKLRLIDSDPELLFELDSGSMQLLSSRPENVATYLPQSGEVLIPTVMLGPTIMINNVRMQLVNTEPLQFALKSYETGN